MDEQIVKLAHDIKEVGEKEPSLERDEQLSMMCAELICLLGVGNGRTA